MKSSTAINQKEFQIKKCSPKAPPSSTRLAPPHLHTGGTRTSPPAFHPVPARPPGGASPPWHAASGHRSRRSPACPTSGSRTTPPDRGRPRTRGCGKRWGARAFFFTNDGGQDVFVPRGVERSQPKTMGPQTPTRKPQSPETVWVAGL